MVAFNPELPQSPAPNFTGYMFQGRPTREPTADESGKTRGAALGQLIDSLATTADTFQKQSIDAKIHAGLDKETDSFLSGLNDVKQKLGIGTASETQDAKDLGYQTASGQQPNTTPAADAQRGTSPAPMLIPPTSEANGESSSNPPPAAVDRGVKTVQKMQMAMDNGNGDVSNLHFLARKLGLQQSLRAQYPGYREYIDGKLGNTANDYATALMQQINQAQNAKAKLANEMHGKLVNASAEGLKSGNPLYRGIWENLQKNGDANDSKIWDLINADQQSTFEYHKATEQAAGMEAQKKVMGMSDEPVFTQFMRDKYDIGMKAAMTGFGMAHDPQEAFKQMGQEVVKPGTFGPDFFLKNKMAIDQSIAKISAEIDKSYTEPFRNKDGSYTYPDRKSPSSIYTKAQWDEFKEKSVSDWKAVSKLMGDKDPTMAGITAAVIESQKNAGLRDLINDQVTGQAIMKGMILHQAVNDPILLKEYFERLTVKDPKNPLGQSPFDYIRNTFTLNFLTGQRNSDGTVVTPSQYFDTIRGRPDSSKPEQVSGLLNAVPNLAQSRFPDDIRSQGYHAAFSPGNINMLDDKNLSVSTYDQAQKRWIPGKEVVYNKYLSLPVLTDVKKLSDKGDQQLWNDTKNWAFESAVQHIYPKALADLKDLSDHGFKFGYNPVTSQLQPIGPNNVPLNELGGGPREYWEQTKAKYGATFTRINTMLSSMKNIEKIDPGFNVNANFLKMISTQGGPKDLFDAVKAPGLPQQKGEGEGKTKTGSIDEGIRNSTSKTALGFNEETGIPGIKTASTGPLDFKMPGDHLRLEDAADKGVKTSTIHPAFRAGMETALNDYKEETGKAPHISSLFRTYEDQVKAYNHFLNGGGLAAPPGLSLHQYGMAGDLNSDPKFAEWLRSKGPNKYGLEFLSGHAGRVDPYHVQLSKSLRKQAQSSPY